MEWRTFRRTDGSSYVVLPSSAALARPRLTFLSLPSSSPRQVCYLCRKRVGACIQCANRNCFTAFHVTCARDHGLELKMKQGGSSGELKAYCEKHSEVSRLLLFAFEGRREI